MPAVHVSPRRTRPNANHVRARDPEIIELFRRARAIPLTDKELAYYAGLSSSVLTKIRNGKRYPRAETFEKLIMALEQKEKSK